MPDRAFPPALREGTEIALIAAPWAPGLLVAFGRWRGRLPAMSPLATGKGRSRAAAIAGCLGEMVENLSLAAPAGPVFAVPFHGGPILRDARARDLADPGDLGSEGAAAHPDPAEAALRAICERVERAALARWWAAPQGVPIPTGGAEAALRQGGTGRRSRAWRIDLIPGLPVVLVATEDTGGGRIAIGTACALSPAAARDAALMEALLAEIAWSAPAAHPDRQRAEAAEPALAGRLAAMGAASPPMGDPDGGALSSASALAQAIARLSAAGVQGGLADLTHPEIGLPVMRCLCPDLPSARALPGLGPVV